MKVFHRVITGNDNQSKDSYENKVYFFFIRFVTIRKMNIWVVDLLYKYVICLIRRPNLKVLPRKVEFFSETDIKYPVTIHKYNKWLNTTPNGSTL